MSSALSQSGGGSSSGKSDDAKDFYVLVLQLTNADQVSCYHAFHFR